MGVGKSRTKGKTRTSVKDVFEAAGVRLYRMDCVEGMKEILGAGSVDVVVTSPPYNLGIGYGTYDDGIPREEYLGWCEEWLGEVARVMAEDGSLFLNIGGRPKDPWGPREVLLRARKMFKLQNVIHWIKSIAIEKADVGDYPGIAGDVSVGHYKPINSGRFLNDCHEYVFHLTKTGAVELDRMGVGVPYQDKSNIARWKAKGRKKEDKRCRGNTWFIPYETIQNREDERPHPASFPVKLPEMCIRLHGVKRAGLVMDPFTGIGSSAVAAARLGVKFVGFEVDKEYFEAGCKAVLERRG